MPEELIASKATNYRRWANFPWAVVERGGQAKAEAWTLHDGSRLKALVDRAHAQGLWIRFYTLNGHAPADSQGWTASYNFGSLAAAQDRWRAARAAGVDFIASDQYEALAEVLRRTLGSLLSANRSTPIPPAEAGGLRQESRRHETFHTRGHRARRHHRLGAHARRPATGGADAEVVQGQHPHAYGEQRRRQHARRSGALVSRARLSVPRAERSQLPHRRQRPQRAASAPTRSSC